MPGSSGPLIAACWKRVETRAVADPLTGEVRADPRSAGPSPADEAALEWALRIAEAWGGSVLVVAAGDTGTGEMLPAALAAGASRAVAVALDHAAPSQVVAGALAAVLEEASVVCCGDASVDRGSGSVPAFLAARLGCAQALGLVGIEIAGGPDGPALLADRRLDRGRRERLRIPAPAVVSVEGGTARLRRASLAGVLAAREATIERVVAGSPGLGADLAVGARVRVVGVAPFRPRTHVVLPPPASLPARQRIQLLTGSLADRPPPRTLRLEPAAAADAALEALAGWGELP